MEMIGKLEYKKKTRQRVIKTLKLWGGKLIEPRYTRNISSSKIKNKIFSFGVTLKTELVN